MIVTILQWRHSKNATPKQVDKCESGSTGRWRLQTLNPSAVGLWSAPRKGSANMTRHRHFVILPSADGSIPLDAASQTRIAVSYPVLRTLRKLASMEACDTVAVYPAASAYVLPHRIVTVSDDNESATLMEWFPEDCWTDADLADTLTQDIATIDWIEKAIRLYDHTVSVRWDAHAKANRFSVEAGGRMLLDNASKSDARQWAVMNAERIMSEDKRALQWQRMARQSLLDRVTAE